MKRKASKGLALLTASAVAAVTVLGTGTPAAQAAEAEYEIYPNPHVVSYEGDSWILKNDVNVVYEDGIDEATQDRLEEVFALKDGITVSESDEIVEGKTNVLVGISGSDGYVDQYAEANVEVSTEGLFDELDSYVLDSKEDVITVLGADTDASFYGLTTLYHIVKQMDSQTIRSFHIEDWADVASRGFIEGYYGNPWSTQDRINLMKWGGYYKLNSYFYAPKNDPKHNAQWRTLYTDEEIETLIKPLADAGNESKCRFVFALHTFMNNPVRFDTEEHYQEDLAIVQAKFEQVIEAGVRQVAILADDAANAGADNYIRFLNDMTEWLAEMGEKYPDLKQTLPFCTVEYMYNGQSYYQQFPENVQIVMTGGRIWGEVSNSFTETFTNTAGRGPYMWINWPCTDNSKNHLIMGGYSTFLHPGVDPSKIQGIVLNPMQQSEPSKVAIFGNACYSWNIWETEDEADQAWNDSFKYVDHNSALENEASAALRELSKHMMNQNMDSRVTALQESVDLAPLLTDFRDKLNANTVTAEEADALIAEFEILQEAADTYEAQAGDTNVRDQIVQFLNCWDDTTDAAIAYLNGVKAAVNNDTTSMIQYNSEGKTAFDQSKTHAIWYLDHNEYAEVGVQHIVPFINEMGSWLSKRVQEAADPTVITQTYISNSFTNPSVGTTDNMLDGNDSTSVQFYEPNYPAAGDYFGIRFNRGISVDSLRVSMGGGKNHLQYSKFQYLPEGADEEDGWKDVNGTEYTRPNGSTEVIEEKGLNLENVKAVRLIATKDNVFDSWVLINSFDVNKEETEETPSYEVEAVTFEHAVSADANRPAANVTDGDKSTELWLQSSNGDKIDADAAVILDLGSVQEIGTVYIAQDTARTNGGDILDNGIVEYSVDGNDWQTFGDMQAVNEQMVNGSASARYIRVRNEAEKAVWWRISEITVYPQTGTPAFVMTASGVDTRIGNHANINDGARNNKFEYIVDGNPDTLAWLASSNPDNGNMQQGQGIEITFDREVTMKEISLLQGTGDAVPTLKVEYKSGDSDNWSELKTIQNAGASVEIDADGTKATAIRLTNGAGDTSHWWQVYEVDVTEVSAADAESVYTDVEGTTFTAAVDKESAILTPGTITLDAGSYIGIDMKEIRKLASIDAEYTGDGVELQYSDNGKVWTAADGSVANETARYIRLVNTSDSPAEVNISKFTASLYAVGEMGELISSDIPVVSSWGDTRNNGQAFDGNMTTQTKFGGSALEGNTAVFSFGQEIDINSIRIYTADNTQDYIRDVMVQLSSDGQKWTDAFEIGDGVADTTEQANQTMADTAAGEADSNYPNVRYYGRDDLDTTARYMRLYVTAAFPSRSLIINEVVINGGAYISTETDMAFSGTTEERDHQPSNMLDRDFNTTYRPSETDGSMTYKIDETDGIRSFRVIQSGAASNAAVKVLLYNEETGNTVTEEVGTLAQAINEFTVKDGHSLLSVTFEWGEKIPDIAEIITLEQEAAPADKEELNGLLAAKPEGYDTWTTSSQAAYDAAEEMAKAVAASEGISQTTVDSAAASLQKAAADAVIRVNTETVTALQEMAAGKIDNSSMIYTTVSYTTYENMIAKIEAALEDTADLSQAAAEALAADADAAEAALAYSTANREQAELETLRYDAVNGENYTTDSYAALTAAKEAIDALAAQDKAAESGEDNRVYPERFIEAKDAFTQAMDSLIDVTELKAAIALENQVTDPSIYTEESYAAFAEAVENGKALLKNGTKDAVADAVEQIKGAYTALDLKPETTLDEVIAEAKAVLGAEGAADKYTEDSYQALADIVAEAEANTDDSKDAEYVAAIRNAMSGLVDVTALKAQISAAEAVDAEMFTSSSYKALTDLLGQTDTEKLLESGSQEEVSAAAAAIENAIRALVPRAQGAEDYRDSITLKPEKGYTADSYKAYKEAYEALMNADPSDLSAAEFAQLKAAFEKAEQNLKLADSAQGGSQDSGKADTAVNTGDAANVLPIVMLMVICAAAAEAVVIIRKKRK